MRYYFSFYISLFVFLLSASGWAVSPVVTSSNIEKILNHINGKSSIGNLAKDHPDYPVLAVLKALQADQNGDYSRVIETLEPVLLQTKYDAVVRASSKEQVAQLYVGTVGSFHLWRELLYVLLGRAYYRTKDDEKAIYYFSGVPSQSVFAEVSKIEKGWSLLRSQKTVEAAQNLSEIADISKGSQNEKEIQLQTAYLELQKSEPYRAIQIANSLEFSEKKEKELGVLRVKLLAESYSRIYIAEVSKRSFSEKLSLLEKVLKLVEQVPARDRDPVFSFMAGESYWNLASVLRVEDPEKYKKRALSALDQANRWLTPWAERSIREKKAYLSEDALFFSVAILWEQEKYSQAVPRLKIIPVLFPQGEYREDAYQLLGDHFYDSKSFALAVNYYTQLADIGSPDKAAYGVYKAAWAFYNKKENWKALRHLERLLLYYRQSYQDGDPIPAGSLMKEAEKDMLLILADLLPHQKAIKELELFNYQEKSRIEVHERLARTYKDMGKFNESVAVWHFLLIRNSKSEKVFAWVKELFDTLLSAGKRKSLAQALVTYIPKLPAPDSSELKKKHLDLQKKVISLVLTVHREARKTEDKDIWAAVDALYTNFYKFYPNSEAGDIWFYGAQRQEKKGNRWGAVAWYQRAAELPDFENRQDAALSVLRIAKDIADASSLTKKIETESYQKIVDSARWYLTRFPKTEQRTLAEVLTLEALTKLKDFDQIRKFVVESFKERGFTEVHRKQYFTHNGVLYQRKKWKEAHLLASDILNAVDIPNTSEGVDFTKKVKTFFQETAFQRAYSLDSSKKKDSKDVAEVRAWYRRAIQSAASQETVVKAWHNFLLSFHFPSEAKAYIDQFEEFKEFHQGDKVRREKGGLKYTSEEEKLISSAYFRATEAWEILGYPLKRATALVEASAYQEKSSRVEEMWWEAAMIYGSYYQLDALKSVVSLLQKRNSKLLKDTENRVLISRLLFWNGNYKEAWSSLRPILNYKSPPPSAWLLVRDLYSFSEEDKNPIYERMKTFLLSHRAKLRKNSFLQPIWLKVVAPQFTKEDLAISASRSDRAPAGAAKGNQAHQELSARVRVVGQVLGDLSQQQGKYQSFLKQGVPQIELLTLCSAPQLELNAIKRLEAQRTPPIPSPQWSSFLKKLNSKIRELKVAGKKGLQLCEQQKKVAVYLPPVRQVSSPICEGNKCFPVRSSGAQDVVELEKSWRGKSVSLYEKVHHYLRLGAWVTAELTAYGAKSLQERSLLLGYIRAAIGDSWNAVPLFNEARKNSKYRSSAELYMGRIAWRHGNREIASRHLRNVIRDSLASWEKSLYQSVVSSITK